MGHAVPRVSLKHKAPPTAAATPAPPLTPFIRYALERGAEYVAFVYDGLPVLNVSLAAFPDVKLWQVQSHCWRDVNP